MKRIILVIGVLLMFGCKSESKKDVITTENIDVYLSSKLTKPYIDSLKLGVNFTPKGNYTSIISEINADRNYFNSLYRINAAKASDSASKYIYSKLLNDIVPHWYGTTWDFNGHTDNPNNGEIACGYFVSTTLKHLGFNLNRYKMAQAAGLDEAKLLQPKSDLKIYSNLSFIELKKRINSAYSDGIYFVGLDNHVGYIILKDKILYFLHSSYCDDEVVIELAETSPCFRSNIYVFAEITTNNDLVKKWINNERLEVPNH
ncbi:hypothetical protein [Winogradskyella sp.]|uniref:hypothetical protein n=1 Tax=Winogradskyella sp. TaxID=1883156 RepID=UPI002619D118|nr:hypothetical protein [Winogradskyella sp.]